LQELAGSLLQQLSQHQAKIEALTHEIAVLRRIKFACTSERLTNDGESAQASLWGNDIDADLAAIEAELETLRSESPSTPDTQSRTPKRQPLPSDLPRITTVHEPEHTECGCGSALERIGEDISEKLDYTPGIFTVQRHVRGKWVCRCCETLVQAPVPAHIIDKGIPTAGLLADVLWANTQITCLCIAKKTSTPVPVWPFHVLL
jgi:transposase